MIIVPTDTPGFDLVRNINIMGHGGEDYFSHAEIRAARLLTLHTAWKIEQVVRKRPFVTSSISGTRWPSRRSE